MKSPPPIFLLTPFDLTHSTADSIGLLTRLQSNPLQDCPPRVTPTPSTAMTSIYAELRTLVANLFALAFTILIVLGHRAIQPVLRVVAYLKPVANQTHDVESARHSPRALGQDIEQAFDAGKDAGKDEDLSDLSEPLPRYHRKPKASPKKTNPRTARPKKNNYLEDWVSVSDIPLPPPDAEEEEALRTRIPLWIRRRDRSKRFPAKEEDKPPAARSTRDDQQDESDRDGWSSEDLGIDEAEESSVEDLEVLGSIPVPRKG